MESYCAVGLVNSRLGFGDTEILCRAGMLCPLLLPVPPASERYQGERHGSRESFWERKMQAALCLNHIEFESNPVLAAFEPLENL
jgi:hypothetical protein